jgi:hypothetical protein
MYDNILAVVKFSVGYMFELANLCDMMMVYGYNLREEECIFVLVSLIIKIMKKQLLFVALFVVIMSSCTSYSCPTYSKKSDKTLELEKRSEKI